MRVLHLGDSMGASAALLYADLADAAIAFCPQARGGSRVGVHELGVRHLGSGSRG